jgi:hypothetical protein
VELKLNKEPHISQIFPIQTSVGLIAAPKQTAQLIR